LASADHDTTIKVWNIENKRFFAFGETKEGDSIRIIAIPKKYAALGNSTVLFKSGIWIKINVLEF